MERAKTILRYCCYIYIFFFLAHAREDAGLKFGMIQQIYMEPDWISFGPRPRASGDKHPIHSRHIPSKKGKEILLLKCIPE